MLAITRKHPGRKAFITGAAGGLGLEICKLLAADGWSIGMADLNGEPLQQAAETVRSLGGHPLPYQLDVSDRVAYAHVSQLFIEQCGTPDVLINNAGVGDYGYVHTYGLDNWHWLIGINLLGVVNGCALFVPSMLKKGHGAVLNVASAAAFTSLPKMGAYNVSKAGVLSLSETLDAELHDKGISVSVLMPTFFKTGIMQHGRNRHEDPISRYVFGATTLLPDHVARVFLDRAARGRLRTVLPTDARLMYLIKRISPGLAQAIYRFAERNSARIADRLRQRYERRRRTGQVDEAYIRSLFGDDDGERTDTSS
jgi:NAD(P)-dependent dehydrogenase (short-subunit alcohol dehydrogenase family)